MVSRQGVGGKLKIGGSDLLEILTTNNPPFANPQN